MSPARLGLLCLSLSLLISADLGAEEVRDLVLVAGQSNAVGYDAYASELPADPGDEKVLFWWRCGDPPPDVHDSTSTRQWTSLRPQPIGDPIPKINASGDTASGLKRQYGNFGKPGGGFGPEMGFARSWRKNADTPLAIVKVAFSGTSMATDWNPDDAGPGGACYRALIEESRAAISSAKERGITLRLRALIWVQGESDANAEAAPRYEEALGTMIARLREELEAPEFVALLAVNTRFGDGKNPHVPVIVAAQKSLAEKDPLCRYVDTAGAETLGPRHTHFTAAGTLEVGRRFATALADFKKR